MGPTAKRSAPVSVASSINGANWTVLELSYGAEAAATTAATKRAKGDLGACLGTEVHWAG